MKANKATLWILQIHWTNVPLRRHDWAGGINNTHISIFSYHHLDQLVIIGFDVVGCLFAVIDVEVELHRSARRNHLQVVIQYLEFLFPVGTGEIFQLRDVNVRCKLEIAVRFYCAINPMRRLTAVTVKKIIGEAAFKVPLHEASPGMPDRINLGYIVSLSITRY